MTLPSNQASIRYQRLLECVPTALEKCHEKLDVEHAIQLCYGSGSDNDIFCTMLRDNILQQQFHNEVISDVAAFLQEQNVQEKLYKLETVIRKVDSDISEKEKENQNDKASTMLALQKANSHGKVSPADIMQYQSHQHLLKKKELLQHDIVQLEETIQSLQDQLRHHRRNADEDIQNVKNIQVELEKSADLCSMLR